MDFALRIFDNGVTGAPSKNTTSPGQNSHVHSNKGALDKINDIKIGNWDKKAEKYEIPKSLSQLNNDTNFTTKTYVDVKISEIVPGENFDDSHLETKNDANKHKGNMEIHTTLADKTKWDAYEQIINNLILEIEELKQLIQDGGTVVTKAPTFCGLMPFKTAGTLAISDLQNLENSVEVVSPTTTYDQSLFSSTTVYSKGIICAVPKSEFTLGGITDNNGDVTGVYEFVDRTFNIEGIGDVEYVVAAPKTLKSYNSSVKINFTVTEV